MLYYDYTLFYDTLRLVQCIKKITLGKNNLFLRGEDCMRNQGKRPNITRHYFMILDDSFNASDKSPSQNR